MSETAEVVQAIRDYMENGLYGRARLEMERLVELDYDRSENVRAWVIARYGIVL